MYSAIEEPTEKLAKEFISVLRWRATMNHTGVFVILAVIYAVSIRYAWVSWVNWMILVGTILTMISAIGLIGLRPRYIYKNTRYVVNEAFLQLKTGAFFEKHELIPMTKIQAVATNQGPILRWFNLYSMDIKTIGSSHEIVGLSKDVAIDLRNQIAHLAKIQEVDD